MTLKDAVEAELNIYMLTPPTDKEEDPLAWWKVHKLSFPRPRQTCPQIPVYSCDKLTVRETFQY